LAPTGIDSWVGKVSDASGPGLQFRVVLPLTAPLVAVIIVEPSSAQVADPPLVMAATVGLLEVHMTELNVCVGPEE
jgi:hypothetical protein